MPKTFYELILIFDWFKKLKTKDIAEKLEDEYGKSTVYLYHRRYQKAVEKARKLSGKL